MKEKSKLDEAFEVFGRMPSKKVAASQYEAEWQNIKTDLNNCKSQDEAKVIIQKQCKTIADLKSLADFLDVRITYREKTKAEILDRIVRLTAGTRLKSETFKAEKPAKNKAKNELPWALGGFSKMMKKTTILQLLKPGQRNHIRDLRKIVPDLDKEVTELALAGKIHIYPQDDPVQITQEDRDAAVMFGGEPHHIIYTV